MRKNANKIALFILMVGFIVLLAGLAAAADEVSITGMINDDSQLVADSGVTYDIGDTEKGNEVMDLVGKKVMVKGTVMESDGTKIISITSFDVIE
jgi:hypothetical protein